MTLFCAEHRKGGVAFWSRYEIASELDNILEGDEEFQKEFLIDMVCDFCDEEIEELHKNNTFPINKKKKKKQKRQIRINKSR